MAVDPARLIAYLGPGIGPRAFEVGADVRDAFLARDARRGGGVRAARAGKWLADLFLLARQRLARAGVGERSRRRAVHLLRRAALLLLPPRPRTGRMAALIWLQRMS